MNSSHKSPDSRIETDLREAGVLYGDREGLIRDIAHGATFVTGNASKFHEGQQILRRAGIDLDRADIDLTESGATQIAVILEKAEQAFAALDRLVIVDDTCLYIDGFDNFPGVRTKRLMRELGPVRFRELIAPVRNAQFVTCLGVRSACHLSVHWGVLKGQLVEQPVGEANGDWEYNDFFVPVGTSTTLAEVSIEQRATFSHRAKAFSALVAFLSEKRPCT